MKKIIIAAAALCVVTTSFAQKKATAKTGKTEISINAGIGSPSGNFAKGDYADGKSGFAKAGFHMDLSGTYMFYKNWGLNLVVGYTQFGSKGLQNLVDGYKEDSGTDSTTLNTTNKNSSFNVLVGPVYQIPASSKFLVRLRALVGYSNTTLAGFKVYYEDYLDNTIMEQKKSSGGGFAFSAGAGVTYKISKNISILANADYFSSKPKINISYVNYNVNSGRKIDTYNENISGINATVGIGFSF